MHREDKRTAIMKKDFRDKQQSFMHGSLVLMLATMLVKVIGAIYRIPLANLLGEDGMGYYSTAYDLYLPMYSLAMAGLPVAISRIIAEHIAAGRYQDVATTLKVAKRSFWVTGGVGFVLMCSLAYPFVAYTGNYGALRAVFCIAPCLLICCVMSAYRGYYEGLKNMTPTAISQVIEALGKLVLGYGLSYAVLLVRADNSPETLSLAAAASLLGITVGTIISTAYLVVKYHREKDLFTLEQLAAAPAAKSARETLRNLVIIAVPIVLGSLVTYVTSLIDVVMVQRQISQTVAEHPEVFKNLYSGFLAFKAEESGMSESDYLFNELPNALYGCHRGYAYSIYNLIPTITSVLGVSAIPILASAWTQGDKEGVRLNTETVFRTTALVSMPAGLGIFALAGPILSFLYSSEYAVAIATPNLRILGLAAVFAGLTIPMTSILQAIGRQKIPVRNMAIGAVIKIAVNFTLVSIPQINIKGVPVGTLCCYVYIFITNFLAIRKYSSVKLNLFSILIKPFIAGALCAGTAFVVSALLGTSKIATILALFAAVVVYVLAVSVLKCVERSDVLSLPKGEKIAAFMQKLHIIRAN